MKRQCKGRQKGNWSCRLFAQRSSALWSFVWRRACTDKRAEIRGSGRKERTTKLRDRQGYEDLRPAQRERERRNNPNLLSLLSYGCLVRCTGVSRLSPKVSLSWCLLLFFFVRRRPRARVIRQVSHKMLQFTYISSVYGVISYIGIIEI